MSVQPDFDAFSRLFELRADLMAKIPESVSLASSLTSAPAREHLAQGLSRRLEIIAVSLDAVIDLTHPERTTPLSTDDSPQLNLHLNSIYLHLRGSLDNLAWALAFEIEHLGSPDESKVSFRRSVSLCSKKFVEALAPKHQELASILSRLAPWNDELKELRDPAAHRIPLYVPPSIMTPDEASRWGALQTQSIDSLNVGDCDASNAAMAAMDEIGTFAGLFLHSIRTDEAPRPLHPQLVLDLTSLEQAIDASIECLRSHAA